MRYLTRSEMEIYYELHRKCFGYDDKEGSPPIVMVESDDDPFAFMSGYFHNKSTFYIQKLGVLPKKQGMYRTKKLIRNAIKKLYKDTGNRWIMAAIENDNLPAIKGIIDNRFKIIGVRVTQPNKLVLVEFLRENKPEK